MAVGFHFSNFGDPQEVLQNYTYDLGGHLADDALCVELVASPVHPSDMGVLTGRYGRLPGLPSFGGREGIGKVIATGAHAAHWMGKLVKMPFGAWRSQAVISMKEAYEVPSDIDRYQAAMAFINPLTAWMLLHRLVELHPGDWIIQNAGTSAVGVAVIQIAHAMGVHTLNLVRNKEARYDELKSYGADVIAQDDTFDPKMVQEYTGGKRPVLGFNSIGGESVMRLIKSMQYGGTVVTFGGVLGDKVRFPTRELIFNGLTLQGFWLDRWSQAQTHETMQQMYDIVFDLIRSGVVKIPVDQVVKLSEGPLALLNAYESRTKGKVLLVL